MKGTPAQNVVMNSTYSQSEYLAETLMKTKQNQAKRNTHARVFAMPCWECHRSVSLGEGTLRINVDDARYSHCEYLAETL